MGNGVIQQVQHHLLDEHGVHGHKQQRLRYGDGDLHIRVLFAEVQHHLAEHLLQRLVLLLYAPNIIAADAGDGQQIFHHTAEPVRVFFRVLQKLLALGFAKAAAAFQHCVDGAADGGEGRAKVVGDGPEQVGPHLLLFRLQPDAFLLFDSGGQGGDRKAHGQHGHKGERVAVDGKIQLKIGIGKGPVHAHNTDQRGKGAVKVAVGEQGDDQHRQHKDQGHMHV